MNWRAARSSTRAASRRRRARDDQHLVEDVQVERPLPEEPQRREELGEQRVDAPGALDEEADRDVLAAAPRRPLDQLEPRLREERAHRPRVEVPEVLLELVVG